MKDARTDARLSDPWDDAKAASMTEAVDPVVAYRASGYRQRKAEERPTAERRGAGIV